MSYRSRVAVSLAVLTTTISLAGTGAVLVGSPASGTPALVDNASQAAIYEINKTWAATPVDYNNDGLQDVWIGYHQQTGKLWRNNGDGTYTRVAADAWPRQYPTGGIPDRHDCAFADVDQNGLQDAYCSTGRNLNNVVKKADNDNELWLQMTPGNFTEVGTAWGVGDPCGRGRHVAFIDANGDRYPDLFLGNENPRKVTDPCDDPANGLPNKDSKLFINDGGTGFTYAPGYWNFGANKGERCAEVLDYDHDGWPDLFTCQDKTKQAFLFHNDHGTGFSDVSAANNITSTTKPADATPVDWDGDGDLDVVVVTSRAVKWYPNKGGTLGSPRTLYLIDNSKGDGRSIAAGDIDGDGRPDLYVMLTRNATVAGNPGDVVLLHTSPLTPMTPPSATGIADEVVALRTRGPGQPSSFLVLNGCNETEGKGTGGPVQLIDYVNN